MIIIVRMRMRNSSSKEDTNHRTGQIINSRSAKNQRTKNHAVRVAERKGERSGGGDPRISGTIAGQSKQRTGAMLFRDDGRRLPRTYVHGRCGTG